MKHIAAIIALLFVSAMATEALAQPAQQPGRGPGRDGPPPTAGAPAKGARAKRMLRKIRAKVLRDKVGLSEDKARKVEEIFKRANQAQRKVQRELRKGKQELNRLLRADSDDQQAYAAVLKRLHAGQRATQTIRDKQVGALAKVLTPKEQAKLLRALHKVQKHLKQARTKRRQQKGKRPQRPRRPRPPRRR